MPKLSPLPLKLFQALGDPTRLAVVERLFESPASVSELAAPFKMALPSFVQHLELLEKSGWIQSSKVGRVRTCSINPKALEASQMWIEEQRKQWEQRLDQMDDFLLKLKSEEK